METVLGIAIGVGLSAACGFRIFVPLLMMNFAARLGYLHVSPGFEWISGDYATVAFGTATLLEILAYTLPWLDQALDVIAGPAAVVAGVLVTASMIQDLPPFLKWTLAIIAGGGAAGIVQGTTTLLRAKSTVLTGGVGNILVAAVEFLGSTLTALLAILLPILCLILIAGLCFYVMWKAGRFLFARRAKE